MIDLVIRKYPHRRFYDATRRRFLRLGEIADLIKAGARVMARDRHDRDITAELLARILIHEQTKTRGGPLTAVAMRALICLVGSNEPIGFSTFLGSLAACLEALPNRPPSSTASPTALGPDQDDARGNAIRRSAAHQS